MKARRKGSFHHKGRSLRAKLYPDNSKSTLNRLNTPSKNIRDRATQLQRLQSSMQPSRRTQWDISYAILSSLFC
jgi:hypothetical protein